jgi:hypothetical protein
MLRCGLSSKRLSKGVPVSNPGSMNLAEMTNDKCQMMNDKFAFVFQRK